MQAVRVAAAKYRLGRATGEYLCDLGLTLLSDGHDAAVPLAILDDLVMAEVGPVFERVCRALGQTIPSMDASIDIVIEAVLRDIASDTVAPEVGLQHLMDDVVRPYVNAETTAGDYKYVGESRRLQYLIGAYWSYDDLRGRPEELSIDGKFGDDAIAALDDYVVGYAHDWLSENSRRQ